jgi:hypothetical protein
VETERREKAAGLVRHRREFLTPTEHAEFEVVRRWFSGRRLVSARPAMPSSEALPLNRQIGLIYAVG